MQKLLMSNILMYDKILDLEYRNEMLLLENIDLKKNKLHNLEIYKKLSAVNMYNKLDEEVKEVAGAILMNDKENLTEELLDVIQCCYGIAFTKGINLEEHIKEHNEKLLNRNHKFID